MEPLWLQASSEGLCRRGWSRKHYLTPKAFPSLSRRQKPLVRRSGTGKEKSIGMRKITKSALVALIAVMSLAALVAASVASAGEPLFLTASGGTLLYTAVGGVGIFRAERAGIVATVVCEKGLAHGFILNDSPLAHKVETSFSGKCEQTLGTEKTACTEPIRTKPASGELGLLHGEVLILLTPESGNSTTVTCGSETTEIGGAIIGLMDPPYGVLGTASLLLFKASGTTQLPEEIELLGVLMTKDSPHVEGFLGGKASQEGTGLLLSDGPVQIDP